MSKDGKYMYRLFSCYAHIALPCSQFSPYEILPTVCTKPSTRLCHPRPHYHVQDTQHWGANGGSIVSLSLHEQGLGGAQVSWHQQPAIVRLLQLPPYPFKPAFHSKDRAHGSSQLWHFSACKFSLCVLLRQNTHLGKDIDPSHVCTHTSIRTCLLAVPDHQGR